MIIAFTAVPPPDDLPRAPRAQALDLAIVAAAMLGACAGFLWWNAAPAQIFMGDTGSLAIGGAMAGLALLTSTQLLLPILGGLYVVETLSVIAQVISFRGFGRRVLRMAPIHHHFEVGGWPEFTVIVRFWLFAGLCVALGPRLLLRRLPPHPGGASSDRRASLVIGLAKTGEAVDARCCAREGDDGDRRRGRTRPATDVRARASTRACAAGATRRRGARADGWAALVGGPTSSCRARACAPDHPALVAARARGVPVRSEIDLAARAASTLPIVAVTGTNGKTTVTTLIAAMLEASGVARGRGRQHRPPAASTPVEPTPVDVVVAEVSSFQLAVHRPRVPPARRGRCSTSPTTTSTGTARSTRYARPRRGSSRTRAATTCSCSTPTTRSRRRSRRAARRASDRRGRASIAGRRLPRVRRRARCVDADGARARARSPRCRARCRTTSPNALAAAAAALAVGRDARRASATRSSSFRDPPPPGRAGRRS